MPNIEVNGEHIEYVVQGTGAPAVLLHGAGADAGSWDEMLAALGGNHAVHAFNLRAHGGSSCNGDLSVAAIASDIAAAVEKLALEKFHLVGISLGGAAAIHLAAAAPGRVQTLAVAGVGIGSGQALADEIYGVREMVHYLVPDDFGLQVAEALLVPDASPERVAALSASIGVLTKQRYLRALEALAGAGLAGVAGRVSVPTLVLHGELDEMAPADEADALAGAIDGAARADIPDAGHLACIDNPSGFAAALKDFWGAARG